MFSVFIWEQTETCATYNINWLVFITDLKSVYCAVRTGSLNKVVCASSVKGQRRSVQYMVKQKNGNFWKTQQKLKKSKKKNYWQKLNHYNLHFKLHALQNATESHSAEHATHTEWHKRTGTFEMRSGSERMYTWRRTPSTGRDFQTLIIWITVS